MKILVLGYYNNGNIGDELFKLAFQYLFPTYQFTFVDHINSDNIGGYETIFIGGGSFLEGAPLISNLDLINSKKIFYIGVGLETNIHPIHQQLMHTAQLVATRSPQFIDKAIALNRNSIAIPDLVYSLHSQSIKSTKSRSILVVPNFAVVPRWSDDHWKHASWEYFKSEFAQFMDELAIQKYLINFLPMCSNLDGNDEWAAAEIINKMQYKSKTNLLKHHVCDIKQITNIFSQHQFVVTQRFHGSVIAELSDTPYLTIFHHDKLKPSYPNRGMSLSYYGMHKQALQDKFNAAMQFFPSYLPLESNIFETLVRQVTKLIGN